MSIFALAWKSREECLQCDQYRWCFDLNLKEKKENTYGEEGDGSAVVLINKYV